MEFEIINTGRSEEIMDYDYIIYKVKAVTVADFDSTEDFGTVFKALIKGGLKKVIIDMQGLEFIDSLGIGMIINKTKLLRGKKGDIVLINVPEIIEKIFKPINLQRFLRSFRNEEEAVKYLKVFV